MKKILVASTNPGKLTELKTMISSADVDVEWLGLNDFPNLPEVIEDGKTFAENARKKAIGYAKTTGLWTIADYNGNLEWRPRRIKKEILAYDDCCIEELAINLDKSGFIRFYSVQGSTYLNIVNFSKHQNPHKNEKEKGTEIPEYKEELRQTLDLKGITINRDKSHCNDKTSIKAG